MAENTPQFNDILLYTAPSGAVKIEVIFEGETFWLSQRKMGELFGKDVRTINEHLQNIFAEGELPSEATIRKIRIVQTEGNREVDFYNLDAIIAVGYRVNTDHLMANGRQFRYHLAQREAVAMKDNAAQNWCDTATELTGIHWNYLKVLQKDFEKLRPETLEELLTGLKALV